MKWQHLLILGAALGSPLVLTQCGGSDSGNESSSTSSLDGFEMITPSGIFSESDLIAGSNTTGDAPPFAKNWVYTEFDATTFKAYRSDRSMIIAQGTYTWKPASSTTKAVILHLDVQGAMDATNDKGVRYTYNNVQIDGTLPGISGSGLVFSGTSLFDVRKSSENVSQTTSQRCQFSNSNVTVQQYAPSAN